MGMRKTRDYTKDFRGLHSDGGVMRVRLYEDEEGREGPVVVLSDPPENHNTSITNIVEILAAEVAEELGVVGADTRFIEHYPRTGQQLRHGIAEEFTLVTFSAFQEAPAECVKIRQAWVGGVLRPTFGTPEWAHLNRREVAALLGEDIGGEVLPNPKRGRTLKSRRSGRPASDPSVGPNIRWTSAWAGSGRVATSYSGGWRTSTGASTSGITSRARSLQTSPGA